MFVIGGVYSSTNIYKILSPGSVNLTLKTSEPLPVNSRDFPGLSRKITFHLILCAKVGSPLKKIVPENNEKFL